jgi:hypothetical protein
MGEDHPHASRLKIRAVIDFPLWNRTVSMGWVKVLQMRPLIGVSKRELWRPCRRPAEEPLRLRTCRDFHARGDNSLQVST